MRRAVVNPYLNTAHTTQGDVAFGVDLDTRGILQRIAGGTRLNAWVFRGIVRILLAINGIEGLLSGDGDSVEHSRRFFKVYTTQIHIAFHIKRLPIILITDIGDTQQVVAVGNLFEGEMPLVVTCGTICKGAVLCIEQHAVAIENRLIVRFINQ